MNQTALVVSHDRMQPIIQLVQDGLNSPRSKRAYGDALTAFIDWYNLNGRPGLTKATVQNYRTMLRTRRQRHVLRWNKFAQNQDE